MKKFLAALLALTLFVCGSGTVMAQEATKDTETLAFESFCRQNSAVVEAVKETILADFDIDDAENYQPVLLKNVSVVSASGENVISVIGLQKVTQNGNTVSVESLLPFVEDNNELVGLFEFAAEAASGTRAGNWLEAARAGGTAKLYYQYSTHASMSNLWRPALISVTWSAGSGTASVLSGNFKVNGKLYNDTDYINPINTNYTHTISKRVNYPVLGTTYYETGSALPSNQWIQKVSASAHVEMTYSVSGNTYLISNDRSL